MTAVPPSYIILLISYFASPYPLFYYFLIVGPATVLHLALQPLIYTFFFSKPTHITVVYKPTAVNYGTRHRYFSLQSPFSLQGSIALRSPRIKFPTRWLRSKPSKFSFLRDVYKDYKALRAPRVGLWARVRGRNIQSRIMPDSISGSIQESPEGNAGLLGPLTGTKPSPNPSDNTSNAPVSRRLRLIGFARATRDTYIPRLTSSVTLLATGITARDIQYDEYGSPITFPKDTTFTLFPTYTRPVKNSENGDGWMVSVRGWMWCPGVMSRKNRLILSLAKQITRYGGGSAALAAVDRLELDPNFNQDTLQDCDQNSDVSSISSGNSASPLMAPSLGSIDNDKLIRDRLSSFIARSIPAAHISIVVGAVDTARSSNLKQIETTTDSNGNFETEIFVPYEPSVVQVSSVADETVCVFQEVRVVTIAGYGLISDIDDTVKLTGVIGDKRELMHRLLLGDVMSWNIPPVIAWYKALLSRSDLTFHYVSNSPWQLFSLISQYFEAVQLPPGSIHLKQYTGNIISSLMEPSSSRKKKSLFKIAQDFPEKKFICVGDSGERDIEAYTDLAVNYPTQIKSIYIRVVEDSLSDVNDDNILNEIEWMIKEWSRRQKDTPVVPRVESEPDLIDMSDSSAVPATNQPATNQRDAVSTQLNAVFNGPDPISTSRAAKLPPMIPRKPIALKGVTVTKAPPLPERKYLQKAATDSILSDSYHQEHSGSRVSLKVPKSGSVSPRVSTSSPPPPPPPPPRRRTGASPLLSLPQVESIDQSSEQFHVDNLNGAQSFFELEDVDKRGAEWLQRIKAVLHSLEGTDVKLHLFRDTDDQFFKDSLQDLE